MKKMNLITFSQANYLRSISSAMIPKESRRDYRPMATAHEPATPFLLAAHWNLLRHGWLLEKPKYFFPKYRSKIIFWEYLYGFFVDLWCDKKEKHRIGFRCGQTD